MTKQKKVILDILRSVDSHPTAEWIYNKAKEQIPDLSLGTVYRNLNLLRDNGEIMELNYGSEQSHYDGNAKNHYHFKCSQCGNIYDVDLGLIRNIESKAENRSGHKIEGHRLEFYGICRDCLAADHKDMAN